MDIDKGLEKAIARNVKKIRKRKGFTTQDVADKVGCGRSTIANIENGKQRVYAGLLFSIADVLGCPIDHFYRTRTTGRTLNENNSGIITLKGKTITTPDGFELANWGSHSFRVRKGYVMKEFVVELDSQ